ncbi:MAG TPA: hypothetical protein VLZ07_02350 [Syntrophales bacterium]|nr:hypothetical protein [Syntrophales bacterium]
MAPLRLKDVIEGREEHLGVRQMAGSRGLGRYIGGVRVERYDDTGEFLRAEHEDAILVLTPRFVSELTALAHLSRENILQAVISKNIPLIAVSESEIIPDILTYLSKLCGIAVFASSHDEFLLESRISGLLRERIGNAITVHGTLVNVSGVGVMIVGDSGIGKTECSCELVKRGHRWIADDAVEIERRGSSLYGSGHASVRGLIDRKRGGVLFAEELFGAAAVDAASEIGLIVELKNIGGGRETLGCRTRDGMRRIMGIGLPCREISGYPAACDMYLMIEFAVNELIKEQERGCS